MTQNEIPSEWVFSFLSDIVEIIRGVTYKKAQSSTNPDQGLLPVLRANNIQKGKLLNSDLVYVPCELVKQRQKLNLGDIVVAMSSGSKSVVGKAAKVDSVIDGSFGAFCGVLRPVSGVDSDYVSWFTHSLEYRNKVSSLSAGANINNLKPSHFDVIAIPVAPLAEQKAIAEKLDTLLAEVESTKARLERIPKILKRFRQSVLAAAVSGKLTNPKGGREEVEIGGCYLAPDNWRSVVLGEIANFVTSGSRGWSKYYSDDGSIFIRSQDINSDELDISEPCFVKLPGKVEGGRTKVQRNDLLITITGANVTKCARIKIDIDDGYVSQHVALVRLKDKRLAAFIEIVLKAINAGRYQLQKSAYGGGKPGLNLQNIKDVELAIPDEVEAERIVRRVDQLFAYADTIETQVNNALERVNNLTQSILAKAFRGELTEQWRKDNPDLISGENSAAALLEKIKAERAAAKPVKRGRKRAQ